MFEKVILTFFFSARSDSSSIVAYAEKFIEPGRFQLKHTQLNEAYFLVNFDILQHNSKVTQIKENFRSRNCVQFMRLF